MKKLIFVLSIFFSVQSVFATRVVNKKGFTVGTLEDGIITLSVNMPAYEIRKLHKMYPETQIRIASEESFDANEDYLYNSGMKSKKRSTGWAYIGGSVFFFFPLIIPGVIDHIHAGQHRKLALQARRNK